MKIEKIRKINKSKIIIGGLIGLGVIGAISVLPSYSKYRTTQSLNLVKGKITYKQADLNLVAMYITDGSTSTQIDSVPGVGYDLDEKSKCTVNNQDIGATIEYNGVKLLFDNITQKGTKCNVYFKRLEKKKSEQVLKDLGITSSETSNGSYSSAETGTGGIYSINDGDGTSYFFRGAVTNNYVMFANKCWRIIRINGDGSIRLIYDGTECHANGTRTSDSLINNGNGLAYNTSSNHNAYIGYMYGSTATSSDYNATHTNTTDSNIKAVLDSWYNSNIGNNVEYSEWIDKEAGFCNDRSLGSKGTGASTTQTYYMAYTRVGSTSAKPILSCPNTNDLFTTSNSSKGNHALSKPIGLITADEVVFAGGLWTKTNQSYYLYNGNYYWTMSPIYYTSFATTLTVNNNGSLDTCGVNNTNYGARPVINLKSTTTLKTNLETDKGTINNPYIVQ